eukprot:CAMPEP_0117070570 /NCGR_PEP_ID=MMETSP0472-20121206/49576_1 /TAXON_ID=693140 ORGANISM="Tiarina fusus, Strain LIS" /NCGR_SAMPLE_ID=MMETSP0472 /ASSEMBLY_ACC=CAM_ASM_000603 /LENGTH=511 /DNA_ID=CAMNT_0004793723 /DNA_START=1154 /DNA_END=2689 /DNA_ORIENTATION=-
MKGWDYLMEDVGGGGPVLDGRSSCFDCAADIYEDSVLAQGRRNEVLRIMRLTNTVVTQSDGYWVPEEWLKEWKSVAPTNQLSLLDPIICRTITCEHGTLTWKRYGRKLVLTEVWSFLRSFFPEGPEYPKDARPCSICKDVNEQKVALITARKMERGHHKASLPSLFRGFYFHEITTGTFYVVPISWQKEWYLYVSKTTIESIMPPRADPLLCSHGLLKYNPVFLIDYCINPQVETRVVTSGEWEKIKEFYGEPEKEIRLDIKRKNKDKNIDINATPAFCEECMAVQHIQDIENQMHYHSTKIWIENPPSSPFSAILGFSGKSNQSPRFAITIDITDTIHVLKLKIMQRANIQPIYQQLTYRGEILENGKTVYDYKLIPGARVVLQKGRGKEGYEEGDSNSVDPSSFPVIQPQAKPAPMPVIEYGFAGSLLHGDEAEAEEEACEEWECPDCTLINTGPSCESCDLPNPAIFGNAETQNSEEELDLWTCPSCGVPNEQINNRCIACEKLRQKD